MQTRSDVNCAFNMMHVAWNCMHAICYMHHMLYIRDNFAYYGLKCTILHKYSVSNCIFYSVHFLHNATRAECNANKKWCQLYI